MFLKLLLFFTINICFIYTKCNSYYIRRKFFENLFFLNYNSSNLNNFDINGNKKIKPLGKKRDFFTKLKSREYNERCQNGGRKYKHVDKKFPACFFLANEGRLDKLDTQCDDQNRRRCFYVPGKNENKGGSLNTNTRICSSTFDSIFKDNFNENDRLKKSELISILACICTNIVIQYLKIKEEKKTENFDYSFDYSVMNILKLVNFEYDVNEEITKKKKKKYKKKKNKTSDEFEEDEYVEEVNIDIDNKNTKEEDEKLNEYIKKLEYNTLELNEIEPYIDLFFGKKTYNNVFIKHNIDIQKIHKVLNEALFDKCKEKENVIQLQKFVEEEEKTLKKKKINVRNAKTFNDYMHNFNALEERRNVEEVENILYDDDMNDLMENETDTNNEIVDKKKKKKKKRENSQISKWKKENKYGGKLELDPSDDDDSGGGDDDESWESGHAEDDHAVNDHAGNESGGDEYGEDERGGNEDGENHGHDEDNNERNESGDGEKINSLSYILIKNCDNLEKEKNEEQKEDKSDIVLIKFIYDNKYKCEFRTDIGVIVYDVGNAEKVKMISIGKESNDSIIDSDEKNKLSEGSLKFIENINLSELYSLPYKKRYKKKQKIIKEINQKIDYDNIEEKDKRVLLYTYLRIWDDDLHFYELNKFDIKLFGKDRNGCKEMDENKKYNFLQNYNYSDKEEILITSDMYNKIVSSEKGLNKTNKNIYGLLSSDENFFNNDFISFNLNIYINNRNVINNIDDLINILKPFNCYFSKNILNYLIKIKKEKKEFSFLSSKQFLNNYTFDEKDELFSVNKILDKCKVESRYINLFGKDEDGNFRSNRISKLFVFPITSKWRLKKYRFIKNGESNIFGTRKGMNFGSEKRRNGIPIYSIIDDNKKSKRKNRETSREENKKQNNYFTNLVEDEDTDFNESIDKELINFENLNNIIKLKDENKEDIEKDGKNEKQNLAEKNYFKKMIEKQKKINDFLSLEHMKENVKKHINIVDLDGAIKYFTNEEKEGGKSRKSDNVNNINEEERDEFNYDESPNLDEGISKMEEIELDESIKKTLQDNNIHMHRLNTIGNENKVKVEKQKEEKEKINNFFKDMKAQVKISNDTCVGCGISFQTIDKKRLGYLKNHIYEKVMTDEENSDKDSILKEIYEENEKGQNENADENYKLEFEEIMKSTKQYIQRQNEPNEEGVNNTEMEYIEEKGPMKNEEAEMVDNKPYICERCFDLKYKNSIKNNLIINYSNNNEISAHDFEKYVINIFKKKCFIIYIVDILDLYIYSNLQKLFKIYKKLHSDKKKVEGFYFCINKIDLLKGYKEFTVKTYVHNFLKSHKINILFNNIFLVSAKTGYNVKKLIYTAYMRSKNAFMKKKKKNKKEETEDLPLAGEDDDEVDDEVGEQNEEGVEDEDKEIGDQNEEYKDFMSELYENDENKKILKEYERKTRKKKNPKNVNLYIVGNANSGKSTLINYLLKSLKKEKKANSNNGCNNFLISNSIIPGTTLKNIKIKLNNNLTINDTPGIISNNSMLSYLNFDEMKCVVCTKLKKKIPSIYINENDYIFIGGLVYINILSIKKYYSIMSFFMSDKIPIIKRKRFSKDPKEFLKKRIQSGYLYPPFSVDRFNEINDFKKCYFNINNPYINIDNSSYDIHIQGLGCITFYSFQNLEFDLYTLKNVDVIGRPSLMPYHKKYGMLDFSVKKKT
ncbi:conserved Plasmodium protein, unknown function [Plasmodium chabaudi chabaudi]|uniref:G domain-containing protein n=1 Tax=Plasmodium chabaudi chabaudi TaxID=31271 RepID=A0A1C6XNP9_PLACU|nr:conserved Plasmodium protein, unknown function [Plasmodium chabaudi chabaudi]